MGLPSDDKKPTLATLVRVLAEHQTPYALIGGVAMQLYTEEPRTTKDIDIALSSFDDLPRPALKAAGFAFEARYEWSENWRAPAPDERPRKRRIAVQFSVSGDMPAVVEHAETVVIDGIPIRLATLPDVIQLKLAAAEEPARRPSKRLQDKADVLRLIEDHPELETPEIRARLDRLKL